MSTALRGGATNARSLMDSQSSKLEARLRYCRVITGHCILCRIVVMPMQCRCLFITSFYEQYVHVILRLCDIFMNDMLKGIPTQMGEIKVVNTIFMACS